MAVKVKPKPLFLVIVLAFLFLSIGITWMVLASPVDTHDTSNVEVDITSGNGVSKISDILKEKKLEAQNLISTVNERKKSLKRVGEGLLKLQIDFFENGKEFMKPLRLKDLALETNFSESTISRISNGKYLNTVWGTFSIKYFFS